MKDKHGGRIEFEFTNNTSGNLYLLHYHTPLEGIRSCYLSIKHKESGERQKYNGIIAKRPPPTKGSHCMLLKPNEPRSTVINLTDAYAFPHSGEYMIEYTRPLVYFTEDSIRKHGEDSPLPYQPKQHEFLPLTDPLIIHMEATPHRAKDEEPRHKRAPVDNVVVVNGSSDQEAVIRDLHNEMITTGYPKVIRAVRENPKLYKKWFGDESYKRHVLEVYEKCYRHLKSDICKYHFGGSDCTGNDFAYTVQGTHKVFLCGLFNKAITRSKESGDDSKQQTLVHEWSHAFGFTDDDGGHGYGSDTGQQLAKRHPNIATHNADNYGYFYCDVMLGIH